MLRQQLYPPALCAASHIMGQYIFHIARSIVAIFDKKLLPYANIFAL